MFPGRRCRGGLIGPDIDESIQDRYQVVFLGRRQLHGLPRRRGIRLECVIDHAGQLIEGPCDVVAVGAGAEAPHHLAAKLQTVARILDLHDQEDRAGEGIADLADQLAAARRNENGLFCSVGSTDVNKLHVLTEGPTEMLDRSRRQRKRDDDAPRAASTRYSHDFPHRRIVAQSALALHLRTHVTQVILAETALLTGDDLLGRL